MSRYSRAILIALFYCPLFIIIPCSFAQSSHGIHVATIYGQPGENVDIIASSTLPMSKAAAAHLDDWGFVVVDPASGAESPAQMRPILHHHQEIGGAHSATPSLSQIFFPVPASGAGPVRREVYAKLRSTISGSNTFTPSPQQTNFMQNGVIEVRVPGAGWGWFADIPLSQCLVVHSGRYTEKQRCSAKLRPDISFPTQVPSGLSITVDLEFPSNKGFVRMSFLASNSNVSGSYHVPFSRYSVQAKIAGSGIPAYGHSYTFDGKSQPEDIHVIQSNGRIDFFPELAQPAFHTIPEDYILNSTEYVLALDSNLVASAQALANATRPFVPQSQYGPGDNTDLMTNWLLNSPLNVRLANAKQFYSNSELASLSREARSRIVKDSDQRNGGDPFASFFPHPDWPFRFGGMNNSGTAGGEGLQFAHEGNILLASGGHSWHREMIEAVQAFTRARNNRQIVSVMFGDSGEILKAEQLIARTNGVGINAGGRFALHQGSSFHPNRDLQQDSNVQVLRELAINNAPYAAELIGYYYIDNQGRQKWQGTRWAGSTDRQHTLRHYSYGVLGCLQVPTENCLHMLKVLGEALFAFRTDGNRPSGNGNIWERNLTVAQSNAAEGIFGAVIGKRDNTDVEYASLALQLRGNDLGTFIPSRIALLSRVLRTDMSGQSVMATTRRPDGRDFSRQEFTDIMHAAAAQYNMQPAQYWYMDDEAARLQYCQWVTLPGGRRVRECDFPREAPYYGTVPSVALVEGLNDWGVKIQSTWEGVYSFNSLQHLLHLSSELNNISSATEPAIQALRAHLRAFNNTCERGVDYKDCGFSTRGDYQWLRPIGRVQNPFPNETIFALAKSSENASRYMYMSAIDATMNFEEDPAEGFQTWMRIYPKISYSRSNVFEQWTSDILAWYQNFESLG